MVSPNYLIYDYGLEAQGSVSFPIGDWFQFPGGEVYADS